MNVVDIENFRPVWCVAKEQCPDCGIEYDCVTHEVNIEQGCECPECHRLIAVVTELWFDTTDGADRFTLGEASDIYRQLHSPDGDDDPDGGGDPIAEIHWSQVAA